MEAVVASFECEYEELNPHQTSLTCLMTAQQVPGLLPGGGARAVVERHIVGGGAGVGAPLQV